MSVLIRTLLSLSLLNPFVKKINSFIILFLQLCLYTFILDILEAVHLKLRHSCVALQLLLRVKVSRCVLETVLNHLPLMGKLDVIFVEYHFLDIVRRHLAHEKTLHVSFLETLHNFVFKTEKL